jgi:hypothetical protein
MVMKGAELLRRARLTLLLAGSILSVGDVSPLPPKRKRRRRLSVNTLTRVRTALIQ